MRRPKSRIPKATKAWLKFLKRTRLVTDEELAQQRILDSHRRIDSADDEKENRED